MKEKLKFRFFTSAAIVLGLAIVGIPFDILIVVTTILFLAIYKTDPRVYFLIAGASYLLGFTALYFFRINSSFIFYSLVFFASGITTHLFNFLIFKKKQNRKRLDIASDKIGEDKKEKGGRSLYYYYKVLLSPLLILAITLLLFNYFSSSVQTKMDTFLFKKSVETSRKLVMEDNISVVFKAAKEDKNVKDYESRISNETNFSLLPFMESEVKENKISYRPGQRKKAEEIASLIAELNFKLEEKKEQSSEIVVEVLIEQVVDFDKTISININNATEINGLASKHAKILEEQGFTSVTVGNAAIISNFATVIIFPKDKQDEAVEIIRVLGKKEVDYKIDNSLSGINIILVKNE